MRPAITVMAAVVTLLLNTTPALAYPPPGQVAGDTVVHDPTMIRTPFGYVLYSTHGHLEARTSADGVTFTRARRRVRHAARLVEHVLGRERPLGPRHLP
ncbi:hypothetical protein ACFSTC_31790 [Nonomuraea ferruginea]